MNIFEQSLYGGTRIAKTLKQSVYLKNVFMIEYFNMDLVPGNNCNVDYLNSKSEEDATDKETATISEDDDASEDDNEVEDDVSAHDDDPLPGALVGNSMLNDYCGELVNGKPSMFYFKWVIDFDYTSMYPNIKITNNISPSTQIGRILIDKQYIDDENMDSVENFSRGGKFIEDLETDDGCNLARWFGISRTYDIIKEYEEFRTESQTRKLVKKIGDRFIYVIPHIEKADAK